MLSKSACLSVIFSGFAFVLTSQAAEFPKFEAQEIDKHAGEVVYAVTTADVNGDKKPDVVAVTEDAVYWYENPTWKKHTITKGKTERDNVCIQAHDIDGDGKIDFALGAGWHPSTTVQPSTLQWLGRDAKGEWQIHPIKYEQPTLHRLRFGDVLGTGKPQLVIAPLQGRGTKGPNWVEGTGVKIEVFSIPNDPTSPDWPSEVADDTLHTAHNLQVVKMDENERADILLTAWEGVYILTKGKDGKWGRAKVGSGNQEAKPFKGASEVKRGRLAAGVEGRAGLPKHYVATIEPWHGHQVVAYFPPKRSGNAGWNRVVLAEPLTHAHAVWCDDLDGDGSDEILIGQRDPNPTALPKGPGLFIFRPEIKDGNVTFSRHTIDDGGMACEDALCADLDGDGKPEIIAGGRWTHNVKIYWNKGVSK